MGTDGIKLEMLLSQAVNVAGFGSNAAPPCCQRA